MTPSLVYDSITRLTTLFIVVMSSFVTSFAASAITLSVPAIAAEFNTGAASIGWIITGYILLSAVLSVPFGKIADRKGKKPVLLLGLIIFGVFAALCALSKSADVLIFFRCVQGVGAAMLFSTAQPLLISIYPANERGKVLGFAVAAVYLGLSLGPVIGGIMNEHLGFRSIFWLTSALSTVVLLAAVLYLPSPKAEASGDFDTIGSILFIVSISCMMYGLNSITSGIVYQGLFLLGLTLLVIFGRHEMRTASPVIDIRLFLRDKTYTLSNLAALLNYGASYALSYLVSIYLQIIVGYGSQAAGLILVANPIVMTILSPIAGRLSDRIEPHKLATAGMGLTALGLFLFAFISETYPLWLLVTNIAVIGVGFAFFSSPNTNAVMSCVDRKDYGVTSSVLSTFRSLGHTLSMAVVTIVMSLTIGNVPLASVNKSALTGAIRSCFVVFTLLCIAGVYCSYKRKKQA